MQSPIPEIDLSPAQRAKLLRPQSMPVSEQDRRCIPNAIPSPLACCLDQAINLFLGQILSHSIS
jgi:hypothetical protein